MSLRRKVPTAQDFSQILQHIREILQTVRAVDQAVGGAVGLFGETKSALKAPVTGRTVGEGGILAVNSGIQLRVDGEGNRELYDKETGKLLWEGKGPIPRAIARRYGVKF